MKTLQATFLLFVFVPLVNPAPPLQQESLQFYEYDTDVSMGSLTQQDYEMQSKDIRKPEKAQFGITKLELSELYSCAPPLLADLPTCLLCVCLSGSVYCEEIDIEVVPPLPKETAYLYARFNKIKRIAASDFADITTLRRIDFSGNRIEEIEDGAFSKLLLLEELSLAENRLVKLPVLPPKLTTFNANQNRIKSRGIKANAFKKLTNLAYLYLGHNALESVPLNLPESLRILHLQYNNITSITDDTFCKSNNTRYIRTRMDEIRMEGNPIVLAKHVNAFSCLRMLPVGTYY
ncbi:MIME protein, partial [Pachycephala philippinensis]|nr:MIME protein [Pachycephala philippinensis]